MPSTRKKMKVIGKETYINQNTGEISEMQVIQIEERDANFHKLWLEHILNSIDLIGNQKTKLAFWILENLDSENKLSMTYRQISDKTKISYQTVMRTMQVLIDSNFLVRMNIGTYRVNPDVIFKGGKNNRLNILYKYNSEKQDNTSLETDIRQVDTPIIPKDQEKNKYAQTASQTTTKAKSRRRQTRKQRKTQNFRQPQQRKEA